MEYREDLEKPVIQSDEVLIKVKRCGICGSDREAFESEGLNIKGIILGHEFSGEVVELGNHVKRIKAGDLVTADPSIPCNECYWCVRHLQNMCKMPMSLGVTVNGAMAEYINVKATQLLKLPNSVSLEEGAMLEPLSVAIYAVQESQFKVGDNAVVLGAGVIGLLTLQVLKVAGASNVHVIEPVQSKQEIATLLGADAVFPPERWTKINRLTGKIGPDHVFDCVGLPQTLMNAMQLIRKGGNITVIGIHAEPFELDGYLQLTLKNITLRGLFGYIHDNFHTAISLIKQNKVKLKPLITKTIPLEDVPRALEELSKPDHEDLKIIVNVSD